MAMESQITSEVTTKTPHKLNNSPEKDITTGLVLDNKLSTPDQEVVKTNQFITSTEVYAISNDVSHPISVNISLPLEEYTAGYEASQPEVPGDYTSVLSKGHQEDTTAEPEPEFDTDSNDIVASEPVPEWTEAKQTWGVAWHLYIYIAGCLFLVIAFYALLSLIRLNNKRNLVSKAYFISLNLILCLMGSTRAIYFLVDAYNSNGTFPHVVALILFGTTFPCLSGAFSLQFLALLQALRVTLMKPKVQKLSNLAIVIGFNFILSVTADILVGLYQTAKIYMLVCQIILTLWGLFLSVAYFCVFKRLVRSAKRRQKEIQTSSPSNFPQGKPKLTTVLALKVTLVTSVFGGIIVVLQIYSMTGVYGVLSEKTPQAWPWWAYQVIFRAVEVMMASTMVYVASQPIRYTKAINNSTNQPSDQCSMLVHLLLPCYRLFYPAKLEGGYEGEELKWLEHHSQMGLEQNGAHNQYRTFPLPSNGTNRNAKANGNVNNYKTGSLQHNANPGFPGLGEHGSPTEKNHHHSMLVNEDGYIRFRQDGDPIQDVITSTDDDELDYTAMARNNRKHRSLIWGRMGLKRLSNDQCIDTSSETSSHHNWLSNRKKPKCRRSTSVPNTSSNTPMGFLTPKSLCSTDFDGASTFSFKPPSSIHLRDSIDKALNYFHFSTRDAGSDSQNLSDCFSRTPDSLGSNNPCFKYEMTDIKSHNANGHPHQASSQLKQSKTHLLCQNLAELRSKGASTLSLGVEIERASSSEATEEDLEFREISKRASLCRSNSDIILL